MGAEVSRAARGVVLAIAASALFWVALWLATLAAWAVLLLGPCDGREDARVEPTGGEELHVHVVSLVDRDQPDAERASLHDRLIRPREVSRRPDEVLRARRAAHGGVLADRPAPRSHGDSE